MKKEIRYWTKKNERIPFWVMFFLAIITSILLTYFVKDIRGLVIDSSVWFKILYAVIIFPLGVGISWFFLVMLFLFVAKELFYIDCSYKSIIIVTPENKILRISGFVRSSDLRGSKQISNTLHLSEINFSNTIGIQVWEENRRVKKIEMDLIFSFKDISEEEILQKIYERFGLEYLKDPENVLEKVNGNVQRFKQENFEQIKDLNNGNDVKQANRLKEILENFYGEVLKKENLNDIVFLSSVSFIAI